MVLAVLALGASCSSGGGSARLARSTPKVEWTNSDGHWASQPQTVGGRFVAYLERDGQLYVTAVDPTTGGTAWEMPASASSLTPGVALRLGHDDRRVYFGEPVDVGGTGALVRVVAVDAESGTEAWRTSEVLQVTSIVSSCDDDTTMLCTSAGGASVRIAKETGQLTTLPLPRATTTGPLGAGRELGAGLYDLGGSSPERIASIDATGRTLWTKTPSALFMGKPVSPDLGWIWDKYDEVLVGWLGEADGDPSRTDLTKTSISGVDAATGTVLWFVDGVDFGCRVGVRVIPRRPAPVGCRMTGTITGDKDDLVVTDLTVVMQQFDPATGDIAWEADLGPAISFVLGKPPLIRLSPTTLVVGRQDGSSIVVDLTTGRTRVPRLDDLGWCSSDNKVRDVRAYGPTGLRLGQPYLTPCRFDGSPVDVLAPNPPDEVAKSGPFVAWVDATGMHAAKTA